MYLYDVKKTSRVLKKPRNYSFFSLNKYIFDFYEFAKREI